MINDEIEKGGNIVLIILTFIILDKISSQIYLQLNLDQYTFASSRM